MKVCPECQARFAGNESFCPNDATPLVDARALSPGELTGTDLNPQIHLERLDFSDTLGERYQGHLRADKTPLRVTVCNQGFVPDPARLTVLEARRAALGEFLPPEILSLHSLDIKGERAFIAEEAPRGASLQALLDERKALDWQTAARITCGVGRALEYLAERGLMHLGLNARAIFITDLKQGRIQLGEWTHSLLAHPERPLDLADDTPNTFFGYSAYLAPEAIRDASDADQRSLVYSLGILFYQLIVGKPPFTSKSPTDTLKRHLHEKPLKLSIARGVAGLHPDLDDILDTMWIKTPERRFQKIAAALAAISSLLEESPQAVAPALKPAQKAVFSALPAPEKSESSEKADSSADADTADISAGEKHTALGMPAVSMTDAQDAQEEAEDSDAPLAEGTESPAEESVEEDAPKPSKTPETTDESTPSIIIEDPELRTAAGFDKAAGEQPEEASKASENDASADGEEGEDEPESPGTLMMGTVTDKDDSGANKDDSGANKDDSGANKDDSGANKDDSGANKSDSEANKDDSGAHKSDSGANKDDSGANKDDADETETASEDPSAKKDEKKKKKKGKKKKKDAEKAADESDNEDSQKDDATPASDASDKTEKPSSEKAAEKSNDQEKADAAFEIGFMETENDGGGEFAETWFGVDAENTWSQTQVLEHYEDAENRLKYVTMGVVGLIAVLAVGFVIWTQTQGEKPQQQENVAAAQPEDQDEQNKARAKRLRISFDEAVASKHLIRPYRDSAVSRLEKLKSAARDAAIYTEARDVFVEKSMAMAREQEAENLSYAVDLAGYAAQFAGEDTRVKAYAQKLRERLASGEGSSPAEEEEKAPGVDEAGADGDKAAQAPPAKRAPQPGASTPTTAASRKKAAPPAAKPAPAPAKKKRSASDIIAEARAALKQKKTDEAARLYREALAAAPSNAAANAALGDILFNQARHVEALTYQKKAVQSAPRNTAYAISLGRTYFRLKQYPAARKAWQQALANDPGNTTVQKLLELVESKL